MPKLSGMALAMGGVLLLVGSMMSLSYASDISQWFPVLLIGGSALVWFGIHKYREAY
jgi:hypothetical protein